jgi:hypothetical protein
MPMSSFDRFAYGVMRIEDLAPQVVAALQAQLLSGEVVRQIIFAPRQNQPPARHRPGVRLGAWFSKQSTPHWVLALTDERLLVAAIPEAPEPPQVTVTPLADLLWLELGTILLYSWVAWSWTCAGRSQQERVYFNTVRDDLFWDMVNAMRRTIIAQSGRPQPMGQRNYETFGGLPFKFSNLIPRRLLFPGEQTQAVVYQPTIWGRHLRVFRYKRAPATAVVLGPDHLLVAQDDLSTTRAAYGLIARYCPRNRLRKAALERVQDDLWLNVTLNLHETEETFRLLFETSAEPALQTLLAQV